MTLRSSAVGPGVTVAHLASHLLLAVASLWSLQMACVCGAGFPYSQHHKSNRPYYLSRPLRHEDEVGHRHLWPAPGDDIKIEDFSGRHIVLMGDSVTRYQYLSLVSFLEHGVFPGNEGTWETPAGTQFPNPTWEKHFFSSEGNDTPANQKPSGNWGRFFAATNAQLQGHEVCDCWRSDDSTVSMNENRYYHSPKLNMSVSFVLWCGNRPLHGRLVPDDGGQHPAASPERSYRAMGCLPPHCGRRFAWSNPPEETILQHVTALRPTDFVANAGLWPTEKVNWEAVASAGEQLCKMSHRCNLFWKTTTPRRRVHEGGCSIVKERNMMYTEMEQHGWRNFDAFKIVCHMKGRVHVDHIHFGGDAYAMLNRELLSRIHRTLKQPEAN